ncbi:MAG: phosphosulfolactate synthase [Acidobacteriota bacterium]|nr:phosphosulfolactate synthase [Acidobacteriota bacterium]MDE3044143.1 phosphosulfolactate synthase [Acidobacteriota bacterium]MDE3107171.1 phosphosulfolactate synthase [Acidobacteriota bacterium]MDE3223058.1 phosphosulfolactate synthase [Acidobacteriota bacterium]
MSLLLPDRPLKPRATGLTMVIDNGVPLGRFTDVVESQGELVDFIKFGWGTSVVTPNFARKLDVVKSAGVKFYLGGTLFEKYLHQDRFDDFRALCASYGAEYVEVSNGTIDLTDSEKVDFVKRLSDDFLVISEVGSKNQERSENMAPNRWVEYIRADLGAGAVLVTLETRESGRGGICRPNGELRFGLVEEILTSGIEPGSLLFEAPSTDLQNYFVRRLGPQVNLGNISMDDIVGLETIRLGLRSETLLAFEAGVPEFI